MERRSGRKNTGRSLVIVDREVDVIKTSSNFGSWGSRRLEEALGIWRVYLYSLVEVVRRPRCLYKLRGRHVSYAILPSWDPSHEPHYDDHDVAVVGRYVSLARSSHFSPLLCLLIN